MLNLVENPRAEHVRQMAEYFKAELDEGNDASTISMDNNQAKGFISSYQLYPGLMVWVYNITFHSDFKVQLELTENGPFYFSYNVTGHFLHKFLNEKNYSDISQNQHMTVIGSPDAGVEIVFPAKVKLEIAVLLIDMKTLATVNARNPKRIHLEVQKIFRFVRDGHPFRHLGSIDPETKKYASLICENNNTELVGSLMTQGAVMNMFASQLQAYERDTGKA